MGRLFKNPADGPAPLWNVHTTTTVDGGLLNRGYLSSGPIDDSDVVFHLVFYDGLEMSSDLPALTSTVPSSMQFLYHLTFEDVMIRTLPGY